jgi:hypothetical protein
MKETLRNGAPSRRGERLAASRAATAMIVRTAVAACLALTVSASGPKAQEAATDSSWSFRVSPYVWFAGLSGDVAAFPSLPPVEVDAAFRDIFKNLDWFPPPVMIAAEARRGRFAAVADFIYIGMTADGSTGSVLFPAAELDLTTVVATLGGSYRVMESESFALDVRGGGRLWHSDTELTLITAGGGAVGASNGETWVDPIIGLSGQLGLGENFAVRIAGDVGGFGVASDLTWQVLGTVVYQAEDWIALEAGYRHLAVDYEDDGFVYDVSLSGPIIGASFRF